MDLTHQAQRSFQPRQSLPMSVLRPPLPGFNQYLAGDKSDLLKAITNGARPGLKPGPFGPKSDALTTAPVRPKGI